MSDDQQQQNAPGQKKSIWGKYTPWTCGACHYFPIAVSKTECPKCHTPRAGTAQAAAEDASGQTTRIYEGEKALQAGIAEMARLGWRVASQSSFQPRAGVGRTVALGFIGAALVKPPMKFTVVYERIPDQQQSQRP